jgi:hypothetical protein
LSGAAVPDHHHVRCRLSAAQAHGHGQHQGIKTMLERFRFHQWFLVQVPAELKSVWPFFIVVRFAPRCGCHFKLLQGPVKKQVDFLLRVNFYRTKQQPNASVGASLLAMDLKRRDHPGNTRYR